MKIKAISSEVGDYDCVRARKKAETNKSLNSASVGNGRKMFNTLYQITCFNLMLKQVIWTAESVN